LFVDFLLFDSSLTDGGAYTAGESNGYTGDGLVQTSAGGVVVVSINYRLNVFGFLGSKQIQSSTSDKSAGNFGSKHPKMIPSNIK
jgi:para-nitrobenzyl esterase